MHITSLRAAPQVTLTSININGGYATPRVLLCYIRYSVLFPPQRFHKDVITIWYSLTYGMYIWYNNTLVYGSRLLHNYLFTHQFVSWLT